ncbi:tyrosine-type recombinase/integrase [Vagococcus vulneris]|uniref:Tyr recombinase domain-containing protein n=1 Tax=Vagococcus vulneris TaxID=1977869 RepID=A0A430A269_9ENTE|nr:tyrosine-type recombinase/integrase [Vagococcus vulneris]RSU00538.1 hypothetical protein CBF37_00550 [Vagococcus vulneris]
MADHSEQIINEPNEEFELRRKIRERTQNFTPTMLSFIQEMLATVSTATVYEYVKDLSLLLIYTKKKDKKNRISDFRMCNLPFEHYENFFDYIKRYALTYKTTTGKEVTQLFTNTEQGVNRKIATMLRWTRYLEITKKTETPVYHSLKLIQTTRRSKTYLMDDTVVTLLDSIESLDAIDSWQAQQYAEKTAPRDLALISLIDLSNHQIFVVRRKNREQHIIIPMQAQRYLRNFINSRLLTAQTDTVELFLFESLHSGKMHQKTVRLMLTKYSQRFSLTTNITPQLLRNTCEHKLYLLFSKNQNKVNWAMGKSYYEFIGEIDLKNRWLQLTYM